MTELEWVPDNPRRGAKKPVLDRWVVKRYREDPSTLPYEVPTPGVERYARTQHKTWYWLTHDFETYTCPDCGRGVDEARTIDVHHIDGNPRNGSPDNLGALCRYCHQQRHGDGGKKSRPLEVWKQEFAEALEGGT